MQNKEYKKLENKGWLQMQQMLNQELPVKEEKRRRFVPWFWLSSAAAVFGLVVFFSMFWESPQTKNSTVENQMTPANIESNIESEFKEETTTFSNKKEITNITDNELEKKETDFKKIEITKSNQAEIVEEFSTNTAEIVKEKVIVSTDVPKTAIPQNIERTGETNTIFISETVEKLPLLKAELVFNKLEVLDFQPITLAKTKPKKERKAKAQWVMNAGILNTTQPKIHGFESGIQVQIPFNKKWSLQTGLNYRFVTQENILYSRKLVSNISIDTIESIGTSPVTVDDELALVAALEQSNYNSRTNNYEFEFEDSYHYLSIPLEVRFQVNEANGIWFGTELSYLLNAVQSNSIVDYYSYNFRDNDIFDSALSSNSITNQTIPRFDLGITIGYQYQLNTKLGISLSYHHGNLIQQKDWHLDNRFFKAGANYKF